MAKIFGTEFGIIRRRNRKCGYVISACSKVARCIKRAFGATTQDLDWKAYGKSVKKKQKITKRRALFLSLNEK